MEHADTRKRHSYEQSCYVSWNVWIILDGVVLVRVHTLLGVVIRQYQHRPGCGRSITMLTILSVCDPPHGQQHVCFAKPA